MYDKIHYNIKNKKLKKIKKLKIKIMWDFNKKYFSMHAWGSRKERVSENLEIIRKCELISIG